MTNDRNEQFNHVSKKKLNWKIGIAICTIGLGLVGISSKAQTKGLPQKKKPNIVVILTDDHRHDFMGFTGKVPWLKTPALDEMAKGGTWIRNATVTTSLCSPSRASILTGQYAHTHQVVDNFSPLPKDLKFFPEYLQQAGYQTAFFGKWHMGNTGDQPQKGFHHWESFEGQGVYFNPLLNINGQHHQYQDSSYITDLLTHHATEWIIKHQNKKSSPTADQPFLVYVSHKGVHDEFKPAPRHRGLYAQKPIPYPSSINLTASAQSKIWGDTQLAPIGSTLSSTDKRYNIRDIPKWVFAQRNSWHGVDFMYDGRVEFDEFYRRYAETLMGVDESVATILKTLKEQNIDRETIVLYLGDNGFLMGEHGLIDKRNMYEESQKIPMLIYGPGWIPARDTIEQVIQNIDIAPTLLQFAQVKIPNQMQGQSFVPLLQAKKTERNTIPWRNKAFYEYYWEYSYPQTPTTFGIRKGRYKFIWYPGIWDISEFFDLESDPHEHFNLYREESVQPIILELRNELWNWLESTDGMQIPLKRINEKRIDFGQKNLY